MTEALIKYPFGPCDEQSLADAATMTQTINNTLTIISRAGGFGQAVTGLSLLAAQDLPAGAKVIVRIAQGATGRNVTFGAAGSTVTAPVLTGVANDVDTISLVYDGSAFLAETVWQKVVDAA